MKEFLDYDIKYPSLVTDLIDFFSKKDKNGRTRKILDFIESYNTLPEDNKLQPDIIGKICDKLCDIRRMIWVNKNSAFCANDSYYCLPIDPLKEKIIPYFHSYFYNSVVYGFNYIYRENLKHVIPVVSYNDTQQSMGTCFRLLNGIVTAKHCLIDGNAIAIRGYKGDFLNKCKIYISKNENIDLAYIDTEESLLINSETPHVLEDILVMGYPKVPFFLDFCTGEKATISAMAELRMTPTFGAIAAQGNLYYPKGLPPLLLITAKIRGGNSGGPLYNRNGFVVGVATGIPSGEGLSDDNVGYGLAYPIDVINDIIKENNVVNLNFVDFPN